MSHDEEIAEERGTPWETVRARFAFDDVGRRALRGVSRDELIAEYPDLRDEDIEQARRFMKALETTVHHRLVGGSKIPSAKLVEKKVNRVWKPGAAAALQAAFGEAAFTKPEIKSPAQIEKLSSRGKELALEYGYKPESAGLSVAPLSDPRPEAKPKTNAEVFKGHAQSLEEAGF